MVSRVFAATAASLVFLTPVGARADARSDVTKMFRTFSSAKSFHSVTATAKGQLMSADFLAPDRFRATLRGGNSAVIVGSDMWIQLGGKSLKLPGIAGSMRTYLDKVRTLGVSGDLEKDYDVRDGGPASLNGAPTHIYTIVKHGENIPEQLWIGRDSLPAQSVITTKDGATTITYSGFNSPITIDTP